MANDDNRQPSAPAAGETDQERARRAKLDALRATAGDPYLCVGVERTHECAGFLAAFADRTREQLEADPGEEARLAGRVVGLRRTFLVIRDASGDAQVYVDKEKRPEVFEYLKRSVDLGDLVSAAGFAMRTKTDAVTLNATAVSIVAKSLRTPPEKWHGLTDVEARARQRYLDLAHNPEARATFALRSKIISSLRAFLDGRGFMEVETPILQTAAAGAAARPFVTRHNALGHDFYLRIATELPLKKLLVGGFEKVYEIGRVFRNEGMDATHNPEFTSLELYWAYVDLDAIMKLTEDAIRHLAETTGRTKTRMGEAEIDLSRPFVRATMAELVKEHSGVDFLSVADDARAVALAQEHQIPLRPHERTYGHVLALFFERYCEKKLVRPTFVLRHPVDVSPLAKHEPDDPRFAQRFELFVGGKELANAYGELNDPVDQRARFAAQAAERSAGNAEAEGVDEDFLTALEYGMPPAGGLGIGIDRLVMLLSGASTIRDVLLFPTMRPTAR